MKNYTQKNSGAVRSVVSLTRPTTSVISGVLAVASFYAARGGDGFISYLGMFIAGLCLCMFGFAINDIQDIEKDTKGDRKDKPLATKALSMMTARRITGMLFIATFGAAASFGVDAGLISIIGLAALACYSYAARIAPLLKGFFTGLLTCLPMFLGFAAAGVGVPVWLLASIVVFISGREILIDIDDKVSDGKVGMITIPHYVGGNRAFVLGTTLMFVGLLMAYFDNNNLIAQLIIISAMFLLFLLILYRRRIGTAGIIAWSRIPMLLAVLTLFDIG